MSKEIDRRVRKLLKKSKGQEKSVLERVEEKRRRLEEGGVPPEKRPI